MATLADMLRSAGWTAFALNALSDEEDEALEAWLCSLGFGAGDLPELRSLIRDAAASAAHARRSFANSSEANLDFELRLKRGAKEGVCRARAPSFAT